MRTVKPEYNKTFALRLYNVLEEKDIDAESFANQINVSRSTMYNYLSAISNPDISVLLKMCRALKISADYLLGLSDQKEVSR